MYQKEIFYLKSGTDSLNDRDVNQQIMKYIFPPVNICYVFKNLLKDHNCDHMNAQNRYPAVLLTVRLLYCQALSSSVDEVGPVDEDWQCKRRNAALLD